MKRVLILDADQRSALAVARSLGRKGIVVYTGAETSSALAGCSRHTKQHFVYPSPRSDEGRFIETLGTLVDEHQIDMLMPMTELTTYLLIQHQTQFPNSVLPFPDTNTIDSIADKISLMQLADEHNVPIPHTHYVDNAARLDFSLDTLPYPVVIKPGKSWHRIQGKWRRSTVKYAHSPQELEAILDSDPSLSSHPFMIQEHISGHGQGVFCLYDNGTPLAFFAHRRLREKPPSGGVSVLSQSIPVDPELAAHARTLLDNVNWHGIAMVEFKVSDDGSPFLMEINTRFWGSLQLAIDAGVDFPWLLHQLVFGETINPVAEYKIGLRLRWLLGDLDHLYLVLRDNRYSAKKKLESAIAFLTPSLFNTRHEVNRWSDMGPFWCELRQYVRDLLS